MVVKAEAVLRPHANTTDAKQGHLIVTYATTLEVLADNPWNDCEKWARRAVSIAPQDWRTWAYLAHARHQQIPAILCGGDTSSLPKEGRTQEIIGMVYLKRVESKHVDAAEKALNEALQCHDKAKDLAPNDPQRQIRRYGFRLAEVVLRDAFSVCRGQKSAFPKMQFERHVLDELQMTAQLHPDHLLWQSQLAHQLITLGWHENRDKDGKTAKTFRAARPEDEQAIRVALARIEKLGDAGTGETSAYCYSIAAALSSAMQDHASAERYARKVLQLDGKNATAWEQLQQSLVLQNKHVDQLAVAEAMVKELPTARSHYLLARALALNQRYDFAEKACFTGLSKDGKDIHCLLGYAALAMRNRDDAKWLQFAGELLDKANLVYRPEAGASLLADLEYLGAIQQALAGESVLPHIKLQRLRSEHPDNLRYEKALSAFSRP
jgi:tetratricopeptide (TPR) repeat protein